MQAKTLIEGVTAKNNIVDMSKTLKHHTVESNTVLHSFDKLNYSTKETSI
jgi:hypothetical protein